MTDVSMHAAFYSNEMTIGSYIPQLHLMVIVSDAILNFTIAL